jgi:uncharacterized protein (TIRG00374 family)
MAKLCRIHNRDRIRYSRFRSREITRSRLTLKRFHVLIGLGISAAALFLALRDVHWGEVGAAIESADLALLALAGLLLVSTFALRALRWRVLLYPLPGLRLWHLFGSLNVGYFMNNVLPFQMGEFGRAYMLSELAGISTTRSLSTVLVERVIDVLTLLLFLLILAPFVPVPAEVRIPAVLVASVFLMLAFALILASQRRGPLLPIIEALLRLAPGASRPKLRQMTDSAIDGFGVLSSARLGLSVAALSIVSWLSIGLVYFLGLEAFGLGLGYEAGLMVVIATTFGFFFPSSPGAFGVYHALAIAALTSIFGVEKNLAVSYALVIHLVFYLPPIFIGTGFLWLERRVWQRSTFFAKLAELRGGLAPAAVDASN